MSTAPFLPPPTRPSPGRWWVCGLLLLATTLNYMDRTALNQTAKPLTAAFRLDKEQYGLLESAFAVAFGVGTLACGWLVDRVSVRWVYPVLVLGWSAAGFLTASAREVWMLFGCRFLLGLFEAGNWPCGIRTTRQVLSPGERTLGNALFQSGTAFGAVLTPLVILACLRFHDPADPEAWRLPFRVIGLLGVVWVVLWVTSLPAGLLHNPPGPGSHKGTDESLSEVFRKPRYWLLVLLVIAVNTSWHTARVWVPLYLQERWGYSLTEVQTFAVVYYLLADAGSWTVGFVTLGLVHRGMPVHQSRVRAFAACTALVLGTAALPFVGGWVAAAAVLFAFGFGALGLFPTYFALSQDVSARHQGKVTGTLGAINSLYLAGMFWAEGWFIKRTGQHEWVLAGAGVPAAGALLCLVLFWAPSTAEESGRSP